MSMDGVLQKKARAEIVAFVFFLLVISEALWLALDPNGHARDMRIKNIAVCEYQGGRYVDSSDPYKPACVKDDALLKLR